MKKIALLIIIIFVLTAASITVFGKNTVSKNIKPNEKGTILPSLIPLPMINSQEKVYSVWEWRFDEETTKPEQLQSDFSILQAAGVQVIYVIGDSLLAVGEATDPDAQTRLKTTYYPIWARYIKTAAEHGIRVEALVGDKNWAFSSDRYLLNLAVNSVIAFNDENLDSKITGIQFDIEPFSLDRFAEDDVSVSREYLTTISEVLEHTKTVVSDQENFTIGFAVPYWLEGSNGNITEFMYDGEKAFLLYHVVGLLETYPSSYLAIMSYRNLPENTISITTVTADYLAASAGSVKFVIGQELNNEEPPHITYYNKTWLEMNNSFKIINLRFAENPKYQGIAVHEMKSYLEKVPN